jgi:hypothetical protein
VATLVYFVVMKNTFVHGSARACAPKGIVY